MSIREQLVIISLDDLTDLMSNVVETALERFFGNHSQNTPDENLLQIKEVAKLLNISVSTLHAHKKAGIIPFHRIGRRVYFRASEVIDSLKRVN